MTEFDVALHRALKKFQSAGSVQVKETPPHGEPADLTVAIATYDDFDGAYFTIHSILVHHREVLDRVEFVLLDNNPEGLPAPMLESFAGISIGSATFRSPTFDRLRCGTSCSARQQESTSWSSTLT